MLVIELKSEALKDRHWKQLMKRLHVNWVLSELTLGQIWDVDLQKNEMVVKDVLLVAQGEMALEEFLKQVKREGPQQIMWCSWNAYGMLIYFIYIFQSNHNRIIKCLSCLIFLCLLRSVKCGTHMSSTW